MRQFLFVVAMVAAAFLGGAVVNGPALRWAQARLLDYLGLKDGGEIASVELPQQPSDPADVRRSALPAPVASDGSSPATGTSPINRPASRQDHVSASAAGLNHTPGSTQSAGKLTAKNVLERQSVQDRPRAPENPASKQTPNEHSPPPLPVPSAVPEPPAPQLTAGSGDSGTTLRVLNGREGGAKPLDLPAPAKGTDAEGALPAPLDASIGPALLASLSPSQSPQPGSGNRAGSEAIPLETAPGSATPRPLPASTASSATGPVGVTTPTTVSDWATLRSKLQALGVSHYTIEGKPGGQVVFSCLIPLAGRHAVTQRFEAEGEDELHAAQAAIRRVALWRAAQSSAISPSAPTR